MNLFSCYWHHRSVPTLKEKNIKVPESNEAGAKLEIIKYSKNSQEETDITSKRVFECRAKRFSLSELKELKTFAPC